MLEMLRKAISSKLGTIIALGFIVVLAIAFGVSSIAGGGFGGGGTAADTAATVGSTQVSSAQILKQANQILAFARQRQPSLTMKAFIDGGGFEEANDSLFDRLAISAFGETNGIIAGKRLIDSELAKIPSLQGPDGKFSQSAYRQLLAQREMTDADVHAELGSGLVSNEVLTPARFGSVMPAGVVGQYAALLKQKRIGAVGEIPSMAYAPKSPPSEAVLASYYAAHHADFTRPERRTIRYAVFDASAMKAVPPVSDAEISAYYTAHAADYAASQTRAATQLVLPDEATAKAVAASVSGGGSLAAAAKTKGLAASNTGALSQSALATQTAPDIATAVFAAKRGAVVGPIKSALGWYVLHVDSVDDKPARSLASAHDAIAATMMAAKRQTALSDLTDKISDQFGKGGALSDAAKQLGLSLSATPPITADGAVYGRQGQTAPKQLAPIIRNAFALDREHEGQIDTLPGGKSYIIYDVDQISRSAPAPLAEIKPLVAQAYMLDTGAKAARAAALKVLALTKKGTDLAAAMRTLGVPLPPVQPVSLGREDLAKMNGQVPPALTLFFGMAPGTTKAMPATGNRGWVVIQLKSVQNGAIAANDPMVRATAQELSKLAGDEYAQELTTAIRASVGVKPNDATMRSLKHQLAGGN